MVSYGIISLSKKLTHNCFSQVGSINEYLVTDWSGHDRWLGSNIMQPTGTCGPWCLVPKLHHSQCLWMTLAKLQVDCSTGPKPPCATWRLHVAHGGLSLQAREAISKTDLRVDVIHE